MENSRFFLLAWCSDFVQNTSKISDCVHNNSTTNTKNWPMIYNRCSLQGTHNNRSYHRACLHGYLLVIIAKKIATIIPSTVGPTWDLVGWTVPGPYNLYLGHKPYFLFLIYHIIAIIVGPSKNSSLLKYDTLYRAWRPIAYTHLKWWYIHRRLLS